jgi:hypothetical protein
MECSKELIPTLTMLVNICLCNGMPLIYKSARIIPPLKKSNLDPELLSNYRPVSNLHFISKLIERTVVIQLTRFIRDNNLFDPNQSAYRHSHSCETTIVSILDQALRASDRGNVMVLDLLDLSAAFDTVNHTLLINKLHSLGIRRHVLNWIHNSLY